MSEWDGWPAQRLKIIHVNMDAFYASVEHRDNSAAQARGEGAARVANGEDPQRPSPPRCEAPAVFAARVARAASGLGAEVGGAIASIGTAWIFLVPLWGWVGRRYGLRRLLAVRYGITGLMTVATAAAFHAPWLGAAVLALARLGIGMTDGVGNLLFLRAVRSYERSEMTTVFVSYRDVAQLGPPLVCAALLSVFAHLYSLRRAS
jgi:MFS family permease